MSEAGTYDFHLIFKGLFRCVPDRVNNRLTILLADARSPQSNSHGEPLRDHRAAIEFFTRDWRNKTAEPLRHFAEVKKANKDTVGIFLLNRQDIQVGVDQGQLSPALTFVEDGSETSFQRLPRMEKFAPGSARVREESLRTGDRCIARVVDLDRGEVRSERTSKFNGKPLLWSFLVPRRREEVDSLIQTPGPERDRLRAELLESGGEINLDLRVTTKVPINSSVMINSVSFPNDGNAGDPPSFMLRPDQGELKVWIKNRELDAILTESDEPEGDESCLELIDFDFELQYGLSEAPGDLRIPYRTELLEEGPVVLAGCACGGCV
jgi:hypothetical protein